MSFDEKWDGRVVKRRAGRRMGGGGEVLNKREWEYVRLKRGSQIHNSKSEACEVWMVQGGEVLD